MAGGRLLLCRVGLHRAAPEQGISIERSAKNLGKNREAETAEPPRRAPAAAPEPGCSVLVQRGGGISTQSGDAWRQRHGRQREGLRPAGLAGTLVAGCRRRQTDYEINHLAGEAVVDVAGDHMSGASHVDVPCPRHRCDEILRRRR